MVVSSLKVTLGKIKASISAGKMENNDVLASILGYRVQLVSASYLGLPSLP